MKASVVLFKQKKLKNGDYPLVIKLTREGKRKLKYTELSLPESEWSFKLQKPSHQKMTKEKYDAYTDIIREIEKKYLNAIEQLSYSDPNFTFNMVIDRAESGSNKTTLFGFIDQHVESLKKKGKIGTAMTFKDMKKSFSGFVNDDDIKFSHITPGLLNKYFEHLEGLKGTTISVYMRALRSIYNKAIDQGYAKIEQYPFRKFKISKINTETSPRAISSEDVMQIKTLKPEGTLKDAQQYFLFGYYGRGINFIDIAYLKWSDISKNRINYTRKKIESKKSQEISIKINDNIQSVLNNYPRSINSEDYIFPILHKEIHKTPLQQKYRINKVRKQVNDNLKIIGNKIGCEIPLTTYTWRHTFATVLKNEMNASIEEISELLNHSDIKVTKVYLKKFPQKHLDRLADSL